MKFDVIGLDSPCVDLAVNVRCFPKPNGAERIQNLSWQGGGKVASGMVAAARLGLCCGIMGNVGDDKYGTFCLRDFQDHGIDTEQMCVRKNRTTNFDIVISDEGSMGRSFVFYPGNAECMTEEELNIEYISNSSYFYMANLDSVTKKAAQMAKQKGSKETNLQPSVHTPSLSNITKGCNHKLQPFRSYLYLRFRAASDFFLRLTLGFS